MNNTQNTCKAITKKKFPCKNHTMKSSNYCYIHSLGKFKGVRWYKNMTIHLIIPVIIALIFFIIGPSLKNQEEMLKNDNITHAKLDKDEIVVYKYHAALNLFLFKFRLIIYSYYLEKDNMVPFEIDEVFRISSFPKKDSGGVIVEKIDGNLVDSIFKYYNFNTHTALRFKDNKPTIKLTDKLDLEFYLPKNINIRNGDIITGYIWLIGEMKDLQNTCKDILSSYGIAGDSVLIDDIERIDNDIENIVKKYRHIRLPQFEQNDIKGLQFMFNRHVNSMSLCKKYMKDVK